MKKEYEHAAGRPTRLGRRTMSGPFTESYWPADTSAPILDWTVGEALRRTAAEAPGAPRTGGRARPVWGVVLAGRHRRADLRLDGRGGPAQDGCGGAGRDGAGGRGAGAGGTPAAGGGGTARGGGRGGEGGGGGG